MVCLFPFTTRPQKHWFADRWAALANALVREDGASVWVLGGPCDLASAEEIARTAGVPIEIVAGSQSNLRKTMALIQRSATSVGVDTGVTHMSIALGRPTVALFGSTCPYLEVGSGLGEVLYEKLPCSPCRRHPTCNGAFTCMRELSVARVLATVRTYP